VWCGVRNEEREEMEMGRGWRWDGGRSGPWSRRRAEILRMLRAWRGYLDDYMDY